jgi:protein-disulfide isomerase
VSRLRVEWTAIVGADLARATQPETLLAGRGTAKLLRLKVESAAALEIQHRSGQIVERVNAFFGHRVIDDIRLLQGSLAQKPAAPPLPKPDAQAMQQIESRAAEVKDPELRAALVRLGARVSARRRGLMLGAFGALSVPRAPRAQEFEKFLGVLATDHVLGRPDAPNVLIDYFSLTCPFCANFHAAVLPQVKATWIDTGRLRFVYRHFPSDQIATRASLLAECGGAKFFEIIDVLFKSQVDWLTAPSPDEEILKVIERAGLPARQCLGNDRLLDKVVGDVQSGQALRVRGTPTLFINEQNYGMPAGGASGIDAILRQVGR